MRLDLDNSNVFETEMTMQAVRDFIDIVNMPEDAVTIFDEAQGHVHQGGSVAWIVIKVTK